MGVVEAHQSPSSEAPPRPTRWCADRTLRTQASRFALALSKQTHLTHSRVTLEERNAQRKLWMVMEALETACLAGLWEVDGAGVEM